jgi:hypothetical protein
MAQSSQMMQSKMLDYFFTLRNVHAIAYQPIIELDGGALVEYECLFRPEMPGLQTSIGSVVQAAVDTGRTIELDLAHGATIRADAPEVIAHVPEGVDVHGPVALVLLLHGYSGCTRVLASAEPEARCRPRDRPEPGFGWAAAHEAAHTRSVLLIPQLAWRARDGSPGRLTIAGEAARLVDEALALLAPTLGGTLTN